MIGFRSDNNKIPLNACVVTMLATKLTTKLNRKENPGEDPKKDMEGLGQIADVIQMWGLGEGKPLNQSFVEFEKDFNGKLLMPKYI